MQDLKSQIRNSRSETPTLIVIAGPTAIGKTSLAIFLAQKFGTEIVSADSRQFFREMRIGTAKPSEQELSAAKHHFVNSHSISEVFNVGDFEKAGLEVLQTIFQKNNIAILAGGSGLFINAICNGFDDLPAANPVVRDNLNKQLAQEGIASLQKQLETLDPIYFKSAKDNPQRMIRALEVVLTTGKPFSSFHKGEKKERPFKIIKIGLNTDREHLYKQIDTRVDEMVKAGLIDEVKSLMPQRNENALKTVGYSEIFEYLDGNITLEKAIDLIKQNTRRFAKRQLTWFRKDPDMTWFEPGKVDEVLEFLAKRL